MDIIIFSKNRACQLELLLRSLDINVKDKNVCVIFTSDPDYFAAYNRVIALYPKVRFVVQTNFKSNVLSSMSKEHVLFLVDDEVMVGSFSEACPEFAEFQTNQDILCVNLRMGRNYDYDFLKDKQVPIPEFQNGTWEWKKYRHDWGYPMAVGSHIFRTKDLLPVLERIEFDNPNTLESGMRGTIDKPLMIGFERGKIVNIPVNRVGSVPNRIGNITASQLNDKFMRRYLINLHPLIKEAEKTRSYFMLTDFQWV